LVNGNESFCPDLPGGEKERMDEIEQDLYGLRPGFILSQVGGFILSQVGGSILSLGGGFYTVTSPEELFRQHDRMTQY
jgi:hypothetical protein